MQKITINGFLGIKESEIELDLVTIIIGEQATGKSVVARLVYFFNDYFADFDEISLSKNEHKGTYDKRKKEEFYKIFPAYSWEADEFEISFENDLHEVCIFSEKNSSVIELKTSKGVANYFRKLKSEFQKFSEQIDTDNVSKTRVLIDFRRYQNESNIQRYDKSLFVPAARSFYATIRDEIFSIFALDNKIDSIILQFGEFYESAKWRMSSLRPSSQDNKIEKKYFEDIVKGQLVREDGRDWIEMERGRIELSKASSGQQEAVPLLVAISRFPQRDRTLIIEEPEAHLFPSAQVRVLDFILRQAKKSNASIMFTTHSPYLLASTNNYILRGQVKGLKGAIDGSRIRAYAISKGVSRSLIDKETGLISADYIDSVSEDIAEDFEKALEAVHEA